MSSVHWQWSCVELWKSRYKGPGGVGSCAQIQLSCIWAQLPTTFNWGNGNTQVSHVTRGLTMQTLPHQERCLKCHPITNWLSVKCRKNWHDVIVMADSSDQTSCTFWTDWRRRQPQPEVSCSSPWMLGLWYMLHQLSETDELTAVVIAGRKTSGRRMKCA